MKTTTKITLALVLFLFQGVFVQAQKATAKKEASTSTSKMPNIYMGDVWKKDEVVLVLIDYQPQMFDGVHSDIPKQLIELNVRFLIKSAKALGIPVILTSVAVKQGANDPTVPAIANEMPDFQIIDRLTTDAWEDPNLKAAIQATGKKRVIWAGLWTEICLAYSVISSLKDGYEAMFVVDAVGGQTQLAHEIAISRMIQAGAIPNTSFATVIEWFRGWDTPEATLYRPISKWYHPELQKLYPNLNILSDYNK